MSDNLAADPLPNFAGVWQTMANSTSQLGQFGLNFDLKQNGSAVSGTFTSSVIQGSFTGTVEVLDNIPMFQGTGTLEYSGSSMDCRVSGMFALGGGTTFGGNLIAGDGQIVSLVFMTQPSDLSLAPTPHGQDAGIKDEIPTDTPAPAPAPNFTGLWSGDAIGESIILKFFFDVQQNGMEISGDFSLINTTLEQTVLYGLFNGAVDANIPTMITVNGDGSFSGPDEPSTDLPFTIEVTMETANNTKMLVGTFSGTGSGVSLKYQVAATL